ncbi:hypothetical protein BS639_21210 [Rouxiella silvae]|uniref:TraG N-terminal Proteobacteria domain-containing protein n=1 Tax=Rouxiella silvae TaxID=1646373 RepID=A0ABX3TVH7_9GAMM|nr:conjugal transfer mating-pair stabilization protein TraG [Rouxiella silvae]ORJ19231.1 hypothetical protein BS639_21210 [Rouxiella silvae]
MQTVYTTFGGDMYQSAFNAVVTIVGDSGFHTLIRMCGVFSVLSAVLGYFKERHPLVYIKWLAIYVIVMFLILAPKTNVQIVDISNPAGIYEVDNFPSGLAFIAGVSTGSGYGVAQLFDMAFQSADALSYSKTGMLFGANIIASGSDLTSSVPHLSENLQSYSENCVSGDIMINHKYTMNAVMNSSDPWSIVSSNPSPVRGFYYVDDSSQTFMTCAEAVAKINSAMNTGLSVGGVDFSSFAHKFYGNRIDASSLMSDAVDSSNQFFYSEGLNATQFLKGNITASALRSGIQKYSASSGDTANILNMTSENAMMKQRIGWAAEHGLATRMLPFFQSIMVLMLICVFPLIIALALINHSAFGMNTIATYASGFLYFQIWPPMFTILNFASNYYLKSKLGDVPLVLSNADQVRLQYADVSNIAGYLCMSIPVLSFYITKGAAHAASQAVGSAMGGVAMTAGGAASSAADGNWSFNNMSMNNVNSNKYDDNLSHRSGMATYQADNGASLTHTADGHTVFDTSGAISNLPVSMKFSQMMSSGFTNQARSAEANAQSHLHGFNDAINSSFNQLAQLSHQSGNSDTLSHGTDSSTSTSQTTGVSMMMSAAEDYAKANHVSVQDAYQSLSSNSLTETGSIGGSVGIDSKREVLGGIASLATGISGEAHIRGEVAGSHNTTGSTTAQNSENSDSSHSQNARYAQDFKKGMDLVQQQRENSGANHSDNASNSQMSQFAATLGKAQSEYNQYTQSQTASQEYSKMANYAETQSSSIDANYNQEFADWAQEKYGANASRILTNAPEAQKAAVQFANERLAPEIQNNFRSNESRALGGAGKASVGGLGSSVEGSFNAGVKKMEQAMPGMKIENDISSKVSAQNSTTAGNISSGSGSINEQKNNISSGNDKVVDNYDTTQAKVNYDINHKKNDKNPIDPKIQDSLHKLREKIK